MKNISLPDTISIVEASARTERWRRAYPQAPKAFSFGWDEVTTLIDAFKQQSIPVIAPVGVRFYLGINSEGVPCLMMVAVGGIYDPGLQCGGTDILEVVELGVQETLIFDFSCPCPYTCSTANALNTDLTIAQMDEEK